MGSEIIKKCIKCSVELVIGDNWYESHAKISQYKCKKCVCETSNKWARDNKERHNERARNNSYKHGVKPMSENKECGVYLGCHVAEKVLSKTFKGVEVMPRNHSGYDFNCNKGKKVDVKSGCIQKRGSGWSFHIERNAVADYFLCIAFDNRSDLTPIHVWLVPGDRVNHLTTATITESTISKWSEYELDISETIKCCDNMKVK